MDENKTPTPEEELPDEGKKSHRALLIIGIITMLLILIIAGAALIILRGLRGNEAVPIVKREETYTIPVTMEESISIIDPDEFAAMTDDYEDETEPPETEAAETAPVTEKTTQPAETEPPKQQAQTPIYEQYKKDPDVTNVLLLGRDARATYERGRTDSMIILSYNKRTHGVKLISLMRDMLIPIEGHDWNRINTAYAFGGIGLCINTLNDVFKLDIQDYMTIDFDGLTKVIDSIGGIDVNLTPDEVALYQSYGMIPNDTQPGSYHMDGATALKHARNRTLGSDFERTRRQRDVLIAIFNKVTSSMSLTDVTSLISSTLELVNTNLPVTTIVSLATDVMTNKSAISFETSRLPFNNTYNGAWYKKMLVIQIDIAENTRLLHEVLYGD